MKLEATIKAARASDLPQIISIHLAAFETSAESNLVQLLHQNGKGRISLVATIDEQAVGHILFSPVTNIFHISVQPIPLVSCSISSTQWKDQKKGESRRVAC